MTGIIGGKTDSSNLVKTEELLHKKKKKKSRKEDATSSAASRALTTPNSGKEEKPSKAERGAISTKKSVGVVNTPIEEKKKKKSRKEDATSSVASRALTTPNSGKEEKPSKVASGAISTKESILIVKALIQKWESIDVRPKETQGDGRQAHHEKRHSLEKFIEDLAQVKGIEKDRVKPVVASLKSDKPFPISERIRYCQKAFPELKKDLEEVLTYHIESSNKYL